MVSQGELSGVDGFECSDSGVHLDLSVQMSAAGYYLGYFCENCGPWSRETDYLPTRAAAEKELESIKGGKKSRSKRAGGFVG